MRFPRTPPAGCAPWETQEEREKNLFSAHACLWAAGCTWDLCLTMSRRLLFYSDPSEGDSDPFLWNDYYQDADSPSDGPSQSSSDEGAFGGDPWHGFHDYDPYPCYGYTMFTYRDDCRDDPREGPHGGWWSDPPDDDYWAPPVPLIAPAPPYQPLAPPLQPVTAATAPESAQQGCPDAAAQAVAAPSPVAANQKGGAAHAYFSCSHPQHISYIKQLMLPIAVSHPLPWRVFFQTSHKWSWQRVQRLGMHPVSSSTVDIEWTLQTLCHSHCSVMQQNSLAPQIHKKDVPANDVIHMCRCKTWKHLTDSSRLLPVCCNDSSSAGCVHTSVLEVPQAPPPGTCTQWKRWAHNP